MNYWIGVIGSKQTSQRFANGVDLWFCMPKSCEIGDKVLLYISKKAAGVKSGMFGVHQIVDKDESKDGICRSYGIFSGSGERPIYVNLKELAKFPTTISFQAIKTHNFLSGFSYVRRNFQATYFKISEKEFRAFMLMSEGMIEQ